MDSGLIMGNIRLYGSTSGYTEVQPPAVAPDGVVVLPAVAGTLATTAEVAAVVTGKILQVVNVTKVDTFSTTSTSLVDVTGLSVAITPSSVSSKIFVTVALSLESMSASQSWGVVLRDSTPLGGTAASSRPSGNFAANPSSAGKDNGPVHFNTLDAPATVSAVTYKIQIAARSGVTASVNTTSADGDQAWIPRLASSITVMEVSA